LTDNLGAIDKTTFGLIYARVVNVQPNNIQLTLANSNLIENDVVSISGTFQRRADGRYTARPRKHANDVVLQGRSW
jgi:hypothetical protein